MMKKDKKGSGLRVKGSSSHGAKTVKGSARIPTYSKGGTAKYMGAGKRTTKTARKANKGARKRKY